MQGQANASSNLIYLTAQIVAAHVAHNRVSVGDLPKLIDHVYAALSGVSHQIEPEPSLKPAVPVNESITKDYVICLEDGTRHRMLKRHLMAAFNLTPEAYRAKWGLSRDYPMVAPSYSRMRSALAKKVGLGTRRMRSRAKRA